MATGKKASTGKREVKRKSRKAIVKNLDVKGIRGGSVKGGDGSKTFYSWQK